jgi:protein ImuB
VTLAAVAAEPLGAAQRGLDGREAAEDDLARLADRLEARFGARALRRPTLRESHLPERRVAWAPAFAPVPVAAAREADRPLRLLEPPEEVRVIHALPDGPPARFAWRRRSRRVLRTAGPERIAPEWWRAAPGTRARDYWKVEDEEGLRLWMFREGFPGDGRGEGFRWFVHGAFA